MSIRVLVADDQAVVRGALALLIDSEDGMRVVGEARDGREAVDLTRAERPDVVVMDLRMPVTDGVTATREITSDPDLDGTRVLVLTTFDTEDNLFAALRAGASGFLAKDSRPEDLLAGIATVAAGETLLTPDATRALVRRFVTRTPEGGATADRAVPSPEVERRLGLLTGREREVLGLVAAGLGNAEIAEALVLSPLTAKTHVSRILTKVGARDRAQLVILAYESGLVVPGTGGAP